MPATQARIRLTPRLTDTTSVWVKGYVYMVDFGPEVRPRFHAVQKNGRCTCALGANCPSVAAVRDYRKTGGEQAPDAPADYCVVAPEKCPQCGSSLVLRTARKGASAGVNFYGCSKYPACKFTKNIE